MVVLFDIWLGLLFYLTLVSHIFDKNRASFSKKGYLLWRWSFHSFMVVNLLSIAYLLFSIQLLSQFR